MPKVSVIVPIYNVEKYIKRCAESLLSQTLDDVEFLFIDDCSTDKSVEILNNVIKKYPHRNDSVKVLRMPINSRQAAVRKYGIQVATGDYLIHCDSDDWVDRDLYEKMYLEAFVSNSDIVACPIIDEYKNHSSKRKLDSYPNKGKELIEGWYSSNIGMHLWSKMVRRELFIKYNIYPFEDINLWEDSGLMFRVFYYADKISYITESAYHYNQANANAISVSYGRSGIDQMLACAKRIDEFFSDKQDAEKYLKTVRALKYLAKLNLITTRFDWLKEFNILFPESNEAANYISLNAFSIKGKVRFIFVKFKLSWLFVLLYKILSVSRNR